MPTLTSSDVLWVRVTNNGTTVTVKCATTEGGLDSAANAYSSSNFDNSGGMVGFSRYYSGEAEVDDFTLKTDRDANGSYETTEIVETFTADANGLVEEDLAHDAAGNLTYDGVFAFTYDAWNRLVKVTKAYRSGGTLTLGSVVQETEYDGRGRRVVKEVKNSADLDCTYHYYYDDQSVVEERNGSDATIKDYVWGLSYIDELVQTGINDDPTDGSERVCETGLWAMQDANYNVLGIVSTAGELKERYEYTPYGKRTVYFSSGSNNTNAYSATTMSRRVVVGPVMQPYGINEIEHQGLMHDEEIGLVYNRARMLHLGLRQFVQRDPLGYVDGISLYQYTSSNPLKWTDPSGYNPKDKRFGLPDRFWDWYHKQRKVPGEPDLSKEEAMEEYEEWESQGRPDGEGHREKPPAEEDSGESWSAWGKRQLDNLCIIVFRPWDAIAIAAEGLPDLDCPCQP